MAITVTGTEFGDPITLTGTADYIVYGLGGDDAIKTDRGNDTIYAGDGDDHVIAGRGNDYVLGGNGNDTIYGQNGNDTLFGEWGDDTIYAGAGDDYALGGHGDDFIHGGSGNDRILGLKGHNDLFGGTGNDYISTGDHTSTADGGDGDDWINVRMNKGADHVVTGGAGADTFEFVYASQRKVSECVVTDFEAGIDTILVDGVNALDLYFGGDLTATDTDDGLVLTLLSEDTITLNGVTFDDIASTFLI